LKSHGTQIIKLYGFSISKLLHELYTENRWDLKRFPLLPHDYYDDEVHVQEFIARAEEQLMIEDMDDWYRIGKEQVCQVRGGQLLLEKMTLVEVRPMEFSWYSISSHSTLSFFSGAVDCEARGDLGQR